MEQALMMVGVWSAAIYAVIEAMGRVPGVRDHPGWARAQPLMPLVLGGVTGPVVVDALAQQVGWAGEVGVGAAVLVGVGAGALAASGYSANKQTLRGKDRRIGTP
ncbi:hypothetical protein FRC96_07760 [Lujinxingia vulgaris]|uniref:Uncharacterized protein n=1 Tax=Lujinxingia vulgaris TaxID=2600176 RepID=A0A5C6XF46_9DELT|nr:hypothetical protein [Lujinxingia vulgaris]TXD38003.1 hypothetical protein FRC96_07760 [Lujinxingia vulgaris]